MKAFASIALLFLISLSASAQLTVTDMLGKLNCKDQNCYDSFVLSKGYTTIPGGLAAMANASQYKATATDCPGKNTMIVVGMAAKAYGYSILIKCPQTVTNYMAQFTTAGYKHTGTGISIEINNIIYLTGKYTSATHPGSAMYLSQGKYTAADTYTIKFQAE